MPLLYPSAPTAQEPSPWSRLLPTVLIRAVRRPMIADVLDEQSTKTTTLIAYRSAAAPIVSLLAGATTTMTITVMTTIENVLTGLMIGGIGIGIEIGTGLGMTAANLAAAAYTLLPTLIEDTAQIKAIDDESPTTVDATTMNEMPTTAGDEMAGIATTTLTATTTDDEIPAVETHTVIPEIAMAEAETGNEIDTAPLGNTMTLEAAGAEERATTGRKTPDSSSSRMAYHI